jgi:hypothetical protein
MIRHKNARALAFFSVCLSSPSFEVRFSFDAQPHANGGGRDVPEEAGCGVLSEIMATEKIEYRMG